MSNEMQAYVAWTNTDLTEGRGKIIPLAICKLKATAIKLGKGNGVQGTDCRVSPVKLIRSMDGWYGPINLIYPTPEDTARDEQLKLSAEAIKKAKELGFTKEEIELLKQA